MGSMDRIPKWACRGGRVGNRTNEGSMAALVIARGRPLRRGLRVGHARTVDIGTQEIRQGPLAGHQRGRQGREDRRLALCPGRKSDWPILSMKSPKATR